MNELKVFENSEFGELGVLIIDGKEYFPATACAKTLGYKRPADAISQHCKGSVKHRVPTNGGEQEIKLISEGDLYRLIVHSKLPTAERFERWVFDEVLPSIRKQGGYAPDLTELIQKTVSETVKEVVKQLVPAITIAITEAIKNTSQISGSRSPAPVEFYSGQRCKLETFPKDLVEQVDAMLEDMQRQQAVNFSMIARFCTINGYTISSPAVKTYFDRHFDE